MIYLRVPKIIVEEQSEIKKTVTIDLLRTNDKVTFDKYCFSGIKSVFLYLIGMDVYSGNNVKNK
jgi:hypothetical protein